MNEVVEYLPFEISKKSGKPVMRCVVSLVCRCGKSFKIRKHLAELGKERFCSYACAGREHIRALQESFRTPFSDKRERLAAAGLINMRVRRGHLIRPGSCNQCGKKCKPDGHHMDYSKPDEVSWLCRSCHMKVHRKEQKIREHQVPVFQKISRKLH